MMRRLSRGQMAVVLSLVIPVLIGAVCLGTDVAVFYVNWVRLQKAADAAVVAGAAYLPSNPDLAKSTARNYAEKNGIASGEIVSCALGAGNLSIGMVLKRNVSYFFGRALGLTEGAVSVKAVAGVKASSAASGLVPIGLQSGTPLTTYQNVILKLAPQQGSVGPGNWEPLAMGYCTSCDPGGSNYKNNLINGYQSTINLGDLIYTETGNLVGPTQQGINDRISAGQTVDPTGTASDYTLGDPRLIEIPIVDFSNINGNSQVPVKGFAELWINSVDSNGNINAEFVNAVAANNVPGDPNSYTTALTPVLLQ